MPAVFRIHDEETHETVLFFVSDDRASPDQLAIHLSGDKTMRVGRPKNLGIVEAWVPTLAPRPLD
jgi:hypothetical protein